MHPATVYLRTIELIPLYATEWLVLCLLGIAVAALFALIDIMLLRVRSGTVRGSASQVGFAMILAVSLFFGGLIWFETVSRHALEYRSWFAFLVAWVLIASVGAAVGWFRPTLQAALAFARVLSCAGALTLLSLPFFGYPPPAADQADAGSTRQAAGPNVVLITIDAMAAEHLIPYGSARQTSPNIAAFASHAIVFDHFHANSNFTTPAVSSILTGISPWGHRAFQLPGRPSAASVAHSLPARLHEAGYSTAYFGTNPWAGARRLGFSAYFDHRDSDLDWAFGPCLDALSTTFPYLCSTPDNPLVNMAYAAVTRTLGDLGIIQVYPHSNLEKLIERVKRWFAAGGRRAPVFLWVHFFPPHDPYAAPAPWLGRFDPSPVARRATDSHPRYLFDAAGDSPARIRTLEARYDESTLYMDHYFGELVSSIRENFGPNTAIIVTADHGESFDHGYGGHSGAMLYEDLIHIPLLIELPGASTTERNESPGSQIDLAPTIAGIAGVSPFPTWTGSSLLAPARGGEPRTVFSMNFQENENRGRLTTGSISAIRANWKLVRFLGRQQYPNMPELQTQLFNLRDDPHEHKNLLATEPGVAKELSDEIDAQLEIHGQAVGE